MKIKTEGKRWKGKRKEIKKARESDSFFDELVWKESRELKGAVKTNWTASQLSQIGHFNEADISTV